MPKQLNHLPKELLTIILANIEVQELHHLRAVCILWLELIESMCQLKRSLLLITKDSDVNLNELWINSNHFTRIELKFDDEKRPVAWRNAETTLARLCPNIQHFAIEIPHFSAKL